MNKAKKSALSIAYQQFMKAGFRSEGMSSLQKFVVKDVAGYGTASDEKIKGISEMKVLMQNQKKQSKGMKLTWKTKPFSQYITEDENTAVFAEDVYLTIKAGKELIKMYLRFSVVLNYINNQWKVIHWHGSKPEQVQSEEDTYGIDSLKQKNAELEKLVEEKTADLTQKNRELEVEAALERVRSRAMAMYTSDELKEVAKEMRNQLHLLGQKELETCAIHLWDKSPGEFEAWAALRSPNNKGKIIESETKFKIKGIKILEENFQNYRNGKKDYVLVNDVAKARQFFEALKTVDPNAYAFLSPTIKNKKSQDISAYWAVADFAGGSLVMVTMNPPEENSRALLRRFADVFGLAFRRFSDLQKAEAQTREAQIEAALERVRSRSMAMHKSEELKQVIRVVLDQFVHLNINVGHAGFYIDYKAHDDMHIWLADPNIEPFFAVLPYFDTPTWNSFLEAKAKGITLHTDLLDFKTKNKFYKSLFKLFTIPEEAKEFYLQCKGLAVSTVLLESVGLYIENFDGTPYTDEENNILLRFGNVFQQAYTRFLDLQKAEAQARESQIQLALERVRARTMAMQDSKELSDTSFLLANQVRELGINAWGCAFHIYADNEEGDYEWFSNEDGYLPFYKTPRKKYFKQYFENRHCEQGIFIKEFKGKACATHYDFLMQIPVVGDALRGLIKSGIALPTSQIDHIVYFEYGYLLFITYKPVPEAHHIFKRFTKEFEQTYIRFLDLQKAEAQAREAQIEAALERVRARTMAMQKSSELNPTADLLFEQLRRLGAELQGVAFAICDKDSDIVQKWTSIGVFSFPYTIEPAEQNMFEAWKNKVPLYEEVFEGERIKKYYETLMEVPAFKQGLQKLIDAGVPMPTWQKNHAVSFQQGYLLIITTKPFVETQIFVRFGKVFEQTYTRFLDLQKAEAQAKEAKIEAALEKVRSRTMAMQSSDELQETAAILFEEFKKLGTEEIYQVTIGIYNEEERLIDFRVTDWAGSGQQEQRTFQLDMNEPTLLQPANAAWKDGKKSAVFDLTGERLQGWLNYRNQVSGITMHSQDTSGRRVISVAYFSKGHLSLSSPLPLAEETIKTLERFANVFDGTYTRFLDLEKAEEQAKEAKIEAALEKVRSRTLAMQKSDELAETAAVLFQQLIALGIEPNRLYIIIMKPDSPDLEAWVTDEDGSKVNLGFTANYQNNPSIKKMYEGWRQQKKSLVMDMQGKELQQYFHYLHHDLKVPFKGGLEQKRRLQYLAYFSHGLIGMASPDEQPAETLQLLERFAAVFNLTFTRFNDLKVAEAHAIQAEQDLIAIKEAKQKAEEALMELQSTQKQLIQSEKMASLGELTAGIAHEIQNPLNFVNNFSEVSNELIDEMNEELEKGDLEEAKAIAADVKQNLEKINHHGKRAGDIVKGMLQHSRSSTGQKELTDINTLCDEYLRLAYHGLRAKDKSFNAKFETDFDSSLPKINVVPQEIGRVILNLINNAFFAVNDKKKTADENYEPTIIVSTKKESEKILISVNDNGNGIPATIKDKIFQPFFTTKPTGQGTGLGLSLSYDIIKAHGGELSVETREGEGTTFIIQIPAA